MVQENPVARILESIATACSALSVASLGVVGDRKISSEASVELSAAIRSELGVILTPIELQTCKSLSALSLLVESRLEKNSSGSSLVDIYLDLEQLAREEFHPKITYHWCAKWNDFLNTGNWFTKPDGLDSV